MTLPVQSFANHRVRPWGFLLVGAVLLADLVVRAVEAVRDPRPGTLWPIAVACAMLYILVKVRTNPQVVQDRVIRLEMRLRLARVLPPERHAEIARLGVSDLVALRFASDAELPDLVRATLAGEVVGRTAIKQRVRDWQADWLRL